MCMLSYFPAGVTPIEEHIVNGADSNPDGHGYAMVTRDRQITVFRSMNADETIERFLEARDKDRSGPALFHSRIATSGHVDITGCHPFRVGSDNRTVLAHNGILFSPGKDSDRSDTAIFADRMLPRFGSLDSRKKRAKLAKFIGPGNKFVILTVNPNRRKAAYLINGEQGHWVKGGAWHSNYDYEDWKKYVAKHKAPSYGATYLTTNWEDKEYVPGVGYVVKSAKASAAVFSDSDGAPFSGAPRWRYEPWPCELCGAGNAVDSDTLICCVCDTCQDCHTNRLECTCWYPGAHNDNAGQSGTTEKARLAIASVAHIPS